MLPAKARYGMRRPGIWGLHETSHRNEPSWRLLHIVVVRILADIADIENDGLGALVLPPMRSPEHLRPDVAGFVDDRIGAVACVFDDLALLHENESGPVVMAMPWHDPAGFDRKLAETKLAILQVGWLLLQIDRPERDICHTDRLEIDFLTNIGLHLVGWAFTGNCVGCRRDRSGDGAGQRDALPERPWIDG